MQQKIALVLLQLVILYTQYDIANGKPLIGVNIQSAPANYYFTVAIVRITGRIFSVEFGRCTGTLISVSHVLTAEHCFFNIDPEGLRVAVRTNPQDPGVRYAISWWITFDQWAIAMGNEIIFPTNDIAMVKLVTPIIENITLATLSPIQRLDDTADATFVMLGWGRINGDLRATELKMATVHKISNVECGLRATAILNQTIQAPDRYYCSKADPYAVCGNGDSGGPLLYQDQVIAVTKGMTPTDLPMHYEFAMNVHLQIYPYFGFINSLLTR